MSQTIIEKLKEKATCVGWANDDVRIKCKRKNLNFCMETHKPCREAHLIISFKEVEKALSVSQEPLLCDKSREPPCHLEPSKKLCQKCELNKTSVANGDKKP